MIPILTDFQARRDEVARFLRHFQMAYPFFKLRFVYTIQWEMHGAFVP